MPPPDAPNRTLPSWAGYALALLLAAGAWLARFSLGPVLHGVQPFAFFYVAVGLAAWFAGTGPALAAMGAGLIAGAYFFLEPQLSFAVRTVVPMVIYLLVSLSFVVLFARARRSGTLARENAQRIQRSEAELKQQHALLEGLAESVLDGILIVGRDGRTLYYNQRFKEVWGFPESVIATGTDAAALAWAEQQVPDPVAFRAGVAAAYAQPDRIVRDELRLKDGRVFDRYGAPVRNDGTHYGWVWTFRDVSAQKRIEAALRDSEERANALSEATFDAVVLHDDGVVLEVNRPFETMFGYTSAEIIGMPALQMLMTADSRQEASEHIRAADEEPYEAVCQRKDGSTLFVEIRAKNIVYRGRRVRVASAHDITSRREAEEALRESEQRFHQAFANAPIGMVLTDLQGRLRHVNRAYCGITGYSENELLDPGVEFLNLTHPDDVASNREAYRRLLAGEIPAFFVEKRYIRKGGSLVWVRASASLRKDREGRPFQIIGLVEDISAKKNAEQALRESEAALKQAHEELQRHAQTLEATVAERTAQLRATVEELEGLSYSLSHDLRAPLRAMKGFSQILEAEYGPQLGDRGGMFLQRITRAAGRLDQLIQDVLTYGRIAREQIELGPIDLEKLAHQLIEENPALQPPGAVVTIDSPLHPVLGHEAYLMQVLSNLVYNAVKFVAPGVQPHVWLRTDPAGRDVRLSVRDNGIGIPPEAQTRIFRMFERFHGGQSYEGTGIGLAIVRKAVERLGGCVGVESEPGRGSTFWVQLPKPEAA